MKRDREGNLVFDNLTEWRAKTSYSDTTVSTAKTQAEIQRLLIDDYAADQVVISERQGGQFAVAFQLKGEGYVIPVRRARIAEETVSQVARLQRQAMRLLYWYLKNLLAIQLLTPLEESLIPYMMLETADGPVRAADAILGGLLRPALAPPDGDIVDGEFTERMAQGE